MLSQMSFAILICHLRRIRTMIRMAIALLTLGISVATATTAIAQDWWAGCNPKRHGVGV